MRKAGLRCNRWCGSTPCNHNALRSGAFFPRQGQAGDLVCLIFFGRGVEGAAGAASGFGGDSDNPTAGVIARDGVEDHAR